MFQKVSKFLSSLQAEKTWNTQSSEIWRSNCSQIVGRISFKCGEVWVSNYISIIMENWLQGHQFTVPRPLMPFSRQFFNDCRPSSSGDDRFRFKEDFVWFSTNLDGSGAITIFLAALEMAFFNSNVFDIRWVMYRFHIIQLETFVSSIETFGGSCNDKCM